MEGRALRLSGGTPAPDPLETLRAIPDAHERLMWITSFGQRAAALTGAERVPAHRVPGCVSAVWLVDDSTAAACRFRGDAEAPILRGLVAVVCARAGGQPPAQVAGETTDLVAALGLERHLSPTRTEGLRALQAHLRVLAARHVPPLPPA
jgi:cysteine desulfuration protein SufE